MREREKILNDFKVCFIGNNDCSACSYFRNGRCTDENDYKLSKEVLKYLEFNEEYKNGVESAWKMIRKIYNMDAKDRQECFGFDCEVDDIINKYTAQDAEDRLEKWESEKRFRVGDIVRGNGMKGVIVDMDDHSLYVLYENHMLDVLWVEHAAKTGKHIDLDDLFEKISE